MRHLKEGGKKKVPTLLRANAFHAMCNFKIAFVAREPSEETQRKTVTTLVTFTRFLSTANEKERASKAWTRAITIVTTSLLQLSTYLAASKSSDIKINLLHQCLKISQLSDSNALDQAGILQAISKEMERRGDTQFVETLEQALA